MSILPDPDLADSGPLPPNGQQRSMIPLQAPFTADKIEALKVGDEVLISGVLFTGRDAVHKYLHEGGVTRARRKAGSCRPR